MVQILLIVLIFSYTQDASVEILRGFVEHLEADLDSHGQHEEGRL